MSVFAYYTTQRPPVMGAVPRGGLLYTHCYEKRSYVERIDRMAWGCAVYNRRLSPQEVADFELVAEPEEVQNG